MLIFKYLKRITKYKYLKRITKYKYKYYLNII